MYGSYFFRISAGTCNLQSLRIRFWRRFVITCGGKCSICTNLTGAFLDFFRQLRPSSSRFLPQTWLSSPSPSASAYSSTARARCVNAASIRRWSPRHARWRSGCHRCVAVYGAARCAQRDSLHVQQSDASLCHIHCEHAGAGSAMDFVCRATSDARPVGEALAPTLFNVARLEPARTNDFRPMRLRVLTQAH